MVSLNNAINYVELASLDQAQEIGGFEKVELHSIIKKAIKKSDSSKILNKGLLFTTIRGKEISFFSNKEKLLQLIMILTDNAVKYAYEESKIIFNTNQTDKEITLKISNMGDTIGKKDLEHIFDRFYRVSKNRNKKGYGLGLSIAKNITSSLGGTITMGSASEQISVEIRWKV